MTGVMVWVMVGAPLAYCLLELWLVGERHEAESYYATFAVPLWASVKMMSRSHHDWFMSENDADDVARMNGWIMTWIQK